MSTRDARSRGTTRGAWIYTACAMVVAIGVATWAMAAPAHAQAADWIIEAPSRHERSQTLDFTLSAWGTQFGLGAWFAFPVVPDGFVNTLNDSFDVEVGTFLSYFRWIDRTFVGLSPLAGVRWKFHLTPEWTAFATAKLGATIGLGESLTRPAAGGTVGSYWKIRKDMQLRVETGWPGGIQGGISLLL